MHPKILLVDDNADLILITQIILKGQGYDVVTARDADEARQKIRIHEPALILLDVRLCDADGRELCEEVKYNALTRGTRVILMSGDDSYRQECGSADAFLAKPFDFDELVETVRQLMVGAAIDA